ncbi:hypothetical protein L484_014175 [Morus notabilis]|uniref:Stigma-specific STIG1-like protein 1 n=1 Tax=Morus notabilis TaxID=981085 RepID=W9R998_9ROSA|nr:hypothetical protein L484_014175 [Morus notabilis]
MRQQVESTSTSSSSTTLLRGTSRFLAQQNVAARMTCDKFPRVCRLKSGEGPDCCKKKCVSVKTDRFNCGMCGYKCKYTEICCKGKCVHDASFDKRHCGGCNNKCKIHDASFDKRHCGGCNNKCKKGHLCGYGICLISPNIYQTLSKPPKSSSISHSSTIFFVPFLFSSSRSFVGVLPEAITEPPESVLSLCIASFLATISM